MDPWECSSLPVALQNRDRKGALSIAGSTSGCNAP